MSAVGKQRQSVADAVGRSLAAYGAEVVFGVLGSGNLVVTNGLVAGGARFFAARHEGGAVCMADGWARVSGRVGVVSVHQGPGLTNAMTGIAEAVKSHTPLLVLAADTPAAAIHSNFRIDQHALVESVGAAAERIDSPDSAVSDALRAWRRADRERRPVVLMLPLDVQSADAPAKSAGSLSSDDTEPALIAALPDPAVPAETADSPAPAQPADRPAPAAAAVAEVAGRHRPAPAAAVAEVAGGHRPAPAAAVAEVAGKLAAARRPVIVAGRGAVLADAGAALEQLAARSGALLATSAPANGLFDGAEFALGIAGGFATPLAQELLPQADLVLAFGATLNQWTTRHGTLFGDAPVVQIDVDQAILGAHGPRAATIVGDAAAAAEALTAALPPGDAPGWRTPQLAAEIRTRRWSGEPLEAAAVRRGAEVWGPYRAPNFRSSDAAEPERTPDPAPLDAVVATNAEREDNARAERTTVDPRLLTIALDRILPADRAVAVDSGHFLGWPAMYLPVRDARAWVFPNGFQAVGLGLGNAIGAAVAQPGRVTVAALGDGGAFMALPELETAVRLQLKLLVLIYDDAAYGAEVHHFAPAGHDVSGAQFPDADLAALGRAAGAQAVTVRAVEDLQAVERWLAAGADGPLVVDAKVDPSICAAWLEDAFRGGG